MSAAFAAGVASPGVRAISAERARQVIDLGYTPEHDIQHEDGSLLAAAFCYLVSADPALDPDGQLIAMTWPWDDDAYKPETITRNLEKAGALIAAEIDRLTAERVAS